MSAFNLLAKLVIYYAAMAVLVIVVLWLHPSLQSDLPIGRVQALLAQAGDIGPVSGAAHLASAKASLNTIPTFVGSLVWLASAIIGALLASVPVSWVYIHIRNPQDYDQSLIDTIVVLPLVVTSIVVVVQHSLALSFSLAGIAGAARYRNTLKSSGDLLFILLSIGIGLSAGIGAVELAILSSAAFNLCFVALWFTGYGERRDMKRYLGEVQHPHNNHAAGSDIQTSIVAVSGVAKEAPVKSHSEPSKAQDRPMQIDDWQGL